MTGQRTVTKFVSRSIHTKENKVKNVFVDAWVVRWLGCHFTDVLGGKLAPKLVCFVLKKELLCLSEAVPITLLVIACLW